MVRVATHPEYQRVSIHTVHNFLTGKIILFVKEFCTRRTHSCHALRFTVFNGVKLYHSISCESTWQHCVYL